MDDLSRAMAIVISETMEPDEINRIVNGGLASYSEEFARFGIDDAVVECVMEFYLDAQSRNGSRGWYDNEDKYAPQGVSSPLPSTRASRFGETSPR